MDFKPFICQFPGLRREEKRAFEKSFKRYSYFESDTVPPVACFVFDFPKPFGIIDTSFNACLVEPELIEEYLDTTEGVKNGVRFYVLDGEILKAMKLVGLDPEAVKLFHATIRKQLELNCSPGEYDAALAWTFTKPTDELFKMGRIFKHR